MKIDISYEDFLKKISTVEHDPMESNGMKDKIVMLWASEIYKFLSKEVLK